MENRLPPLWAHMDFEVPKCYKVCRKKVTLQPLWAHMDFEAGHINATEASRPTMRVVGVVVSVVYMGT